MARARNIKPSIMDNEDLAELEPLTRLLFIFLWMLADREGRLEDRPKRIAAQALPYDRKADVEKMLADLQRGGFIVRYSAAGVACIQIPAFVKHQSPHGTEKDSSLPDKDGMFTRYQRGKNGYATGQGELVNSVLTVKKLSDNTLNHECGIMNHDLLIPDSLEANASSQLGLKPPELDLLPPEFENSSPGFPDCPYTELLALWQKHLPHLAQPRSWEGNRKVVMRQRWVEASRPSAYSPKGYATRADGIAWWDSFFAYITTTKLSHGFESEGRTWVPDLGWVCKQENFQKIIDGRYEQ